MSRRGFESLVVLAVLSLFACATTSRPREPQTLRVLSYNIKRGLGNDGITDLDRAAALIRRLDPDLVALQELDRGVERSGRVEQMRVLGDATNLHPRFAAFMPYQGGEYGIGILSRFPILETRRHELPAGPEPRVALDVHVQLPNGEQLIFCSVHFYDTEAQRLAQARAVMDLYRDEPLPVILAGDFNSTPHDPVMQLVESAFTNVDKGEDRLTFSATDPYEEIDYVLFRPPAAFTVVQADVLDEPLVSDHRPVLVELRR